MSSNVTLNPGTGGATLGTDADGSNVQWQVVKLGFGLSGATPTQVSATNPLPVSTGTVPVTGTFWQATQPVSIASMPSTPVTGTFWPANQASSPDGTVWSLTGTSANVNVTNASLPVTGTFWQATQPVSIASMPSTPVTGTFWQTTQPVSIAATVNANIADWAGAVPSASNPVYVAPGTGATFPVSGTFWQATQPVSIASMPSTPVTGTFWQATQPVSIAAAVAVTGTFWQATQPVSIASMPSTPVTGTFWQATQPISIASMPTTPVTGTFWQTVQPVSQTSQPLPTNASQETAGNLQTNTELLTLILSELRIQTAMLAHAFNIPENDVPAMRADPTLLN